MFWRIVENTFSTNICKGGQNLGSDIIFCYFQHGNQLFDDIYKHEIEMSQFHLVINYYNMSYKWKYYNTYLRVENVTERWTKEQTAAVSLARQQDPHSVQAHLEYLLVSEPI